MLCGKQEKRGIKAIIHRCEFFRNSSRFNVSPISFPKANNKINPPKNFNISKKLSIAFPNFSSKLWQME